MLPTAPFRHGRRYLGVARIHVSRVIKRSSASRIMRRSVRLIIRGCLIEFRAVSLVLVNLLLDLRLGPLQVIPLLRSLHLVLLNSLEFIEERRNFVDDSLLLGKPRGCNRVRFRNLCMRYARQENDRQQQEHRRPYLSHLSFSLFTCGRTLNLDQLFEPMLKKTSNLHCGYNATRIHCQCHAIFYRGRFYPISIRRRTAPSFQGVICYTVPNATILWCGMSSLCDRTFRDSFPCLRS